MAYRTTARCRRGEKLILGAHCPRIELQRPMSQMPAWLVFARAAIGVVDQGLTSTPQSRRRARHGSEQRVIGTRAGALAGTSDNSGRQALPCCGGGDGLDHRRVGYSFGALQGGRRTMRRDLQALLLSLGGLLAVTGSALLVLWAVIN